MRNTTFIAVLFGAITPLLAQEVYEVHALDIRPIGEDYAPAPLEGGFVMASIRESSGAIDFRNDADRKPLSDLYWVPMKDGKPGHPEPLSTILNSPVNDGPMTFADKGNTICYTRNIELPRRLSNLRSGNGNLGLFFSTKEAGEWSSPTPFEYNSSAFSLIHPSFDPSGNALIFSSDMPDGHGGFDLYVCRKQGNAWSIPINLGPRVNGPGNEVYPAWQPDGSLFFSSDRAGGMGRLDMYMTEAAGNEWLDPRHLPEPLNSPFNDHGYMAFPGCMEALFSSDRSGRDAIYHSEHTVRKFRDCEEQRKNNYCYAFRARPHAATMNLPLDHVWDLGDGTTVKGLIARYCYEGPGTYTVRSMLVDRATGSIFHVLRSNELNSTEHVQAYITAPDTVRTGRPLLLDPSASNAQGMTVADYYWDLGDGTTTSGDRIEHVYRKAGVYEVRLDLIAVPGSDGTVHNLCNSRKVIVLDHFKDNGYEGVAAVYQDAVGMMQGFEFQELPYDEYALNGDGLPDAHYSVELFASSDRVSLDDPRFMELTSLYRIVERYDPRRGVYTYSVGETNDLEELYEVYRKVKELNFLDAEVFALQIEKLIDMSELELAEVEELNNSKIRSHSIHFEFNSADLVDDSHTMLNRIKELMDQYPKMRLVVEAHTDDIGDTDYNMELSQSRALAVIGHLTRLGVDEERLIPVGHGKNHPLASNRSEEGRSMNRRVEFRMTLDTPEHAYEKTR